MVVVYSLVKYFFLKLMVIFGIKCLIEIIFVIKGVIVILRIFDLFIFFFWKGVFLEGR